MVAVAANKEEPLTHGAEKIINSNEACVELLSMNAGAYLCSISSTVILKLSYNMVRN
jgi:hypothetical protein